MNKELKNRIKAATGHSFHTKMVVDSLRAQKSHRSRWIHEYETQNRWNAVFASRHAEGSKEHNEAVEATLRTDKMIALYTKEVAALDAQILSAVEYAESLMADKITGGGR